MSLNSACQKDELSTNNPIDLRYSPSPIPLNNTNAKFVKDLAYDEYAQTTFDLFLPESPYPTPLVIFIHGGSFVSGDKSDVYKNHNHINQIQYLLERGIAFATINYRFIDVTNNEEEGLIKPLSDGKRCLQFIRHYADYLNIDTYKIALEGHSAGAGTALWIAFSDNLAEMASADPVTHESTAVTAVAAFETQATYDLFRWETDVFNQYGMYLDKKDWPRYYGVKTQIELYFSPKVYDYRLQIDMLELMDSNDPELWLCNSKQDYAFPINAEQLYHHPLHAKALKDQADLVGLKNTAYIPKLGIADPGSEDVNAFLARKLSY
ncbi:MAG: carboxylesterase family protein [Bacteroidia bacterium]|nr:carboxylesterase family protein [Bacteroidia bacterium]